MFSGYSIDSFEEEIKRINKIELNCKNYVENMKIYNVFGVAILICIFYESINAIIVSIENENDISIVRTRLGRIRGRYLQSRLGSSFLAFRGIRYANAPVNDLRFQVNVN